MLVIAIGSAMRNDDAAAFVVADHLRRTAADVRVTACGDVLSLVDWWAGEDLVVVVDAVRSGAPAGTIHRLDATQTPLPADWRFASSHQVGLAHAVDLARACGRLPSRLIIVGIEGENFDFGATLSPAVAAAIPTAAALVAGCARPPQAGTPAS